MELCEILDKSYISTIHWQFENSTGIKGFFKINEFEFCVAIVFETFTEAHLCSVKQQIEFCKLFQDKTLARIDIGQVLNTLDYNFSIAKDASGLAYQVISTLVVEISKKLQHEKIDLLYFASTEFNKSEVRQQRIYPRMGKMMAIRLNKRCIVHKQEGQTITMMLSGFDQDEYLKFLEVLDDN